MTEPGKKRLGLLQIHLAVFLFGFAGLFGKIISLDPLAIIFGRTLFAGIFLLVVLSLTGKIRSVRSFSNLPSLLFSGAVLAVHWFSFFQSIQVSSVTVGLLTFSTFPVFITFLEPFLFGEKLKWFDVLTALLVVAGLFCVFPAYDISNRVTQGALWGILSGFTFAVLSLCNRMHAKKLPPLLVSFYQLSVAALITLPLVVISGAQPSKTDIFLMMILGIVFTAIAQTLFIGSLRHIRAHLAGVTVALEPLYGIILAVIVLHEIPAWNTVVGGLVILSAVTGASIGPFDPKNTLLRPKKAHNLTIYCSLSMGCLGPTPDPRLALPDPLNGTFRPQKHPSKAEKGA